MFLVLRAMLAFSQSCAQKTSGDFPTVLFEVVSKRSSVIEGSLSVDELNDILDELSKTMGKQYIFFLRKKAHSHGAQRCTIQNPAACL
jgi:hypothetical protein